jgi:apolipoprotein N-acyltransferase
VEGTATLSLFSAVLSWSVFPKLDFWWLSFVCLVPLLYDLNSKKKQNRDNFFFLKRGLVYGFVFMFLFHNWMFALRAWAPVVLVVLLWVLASIYFSIFYALVFYFYGLLKGGFFRILVFPCLWVIGEWLRSLGPVGNSAGALGYSQTSCLPILQLASFVGVFGLSFLVVLVNVLIYEILTNQSRKKAIFFLIAVLVVGFGVGCFRLSDKQFLARNRSQVKLLNIGVAQGNHAQDKKLNRKYWSQIQDDYIRLLKNPICQKQNIIFLPETITPSFNLKKRRFIRVLERIAKDSGFAVVFGTPIKRQGLYYNAVAVVANDKGLLAKMYLKKRLMPFGEYWPMRVALEKLCKKVVASKDYTPGKGQDNLRVGGADVGVSVCLESIYPGYCRQAVKNGAQLLCVLVNNAWFFQSSAAAEHLQMSIMRAVENDRFLIQSANTGFSAIVSSKGRVIKKAWLDKQRIISGTVEIKHSRTVYNFFGDIVVLFSMIIIVMQRSFFS